jgi:osmotically-inducible protein OsmY
MHRDYWGRDRDDPRGFGRAIDRDADRRHDRDDPRDHQRRDFGQADYSEDYAYDPDTRSGYRVDRREMTGRDDYGQADFDRDYAYDPATRQGYRRDDERDRDDYARHEEPRSFDRTERHDRRDRRRDSQDRVIWAVVCERLDRARGLDASHIDVRVEDRVVFLEGTARNRREKRRAEDLAEVEGVVDVVNSLRLRGHDGGGWRRAFGF